MQCLLVLYIGLAVPLVAALMAPAFGQCGGRNYKADCPKEFRCQTVYPGESLYLRKRFVASLYLISTTRRLLPPVCTQILSRPTRSYYTHSGHWTTKASTF